TALQRNPALLNGEQEIKRTRGVIIQVRAQVLPQVTARANFEWVDPNLQGARIFGTTTGTGTTPASTTGTASLFESPPSQVRDTQVPLAAAAATPVPNIEGSDVSYSISVTGTQLVFNGTSWPQIRGSFFQPRPGESPPLEVVGEMPYFPRTIALANAIEMGKERRPFLKQARANVLNQKEQVRAAAGQWLPTITTTGGGEWVSSPTN